MSKNRHTKEAQIKAIRDHDAAGRLLSVAHRDRASAVLGSESLRYDAAGRRSSRVREDGATDFFRYDPAGQVTAAAYGLAASADPIAFPASQTFAYDPAGNRAQAVDGHLTASYQANAVNQYSRILVGAAETIPSYDALGNLLEDDRAAYAWDADIHLLSVAPKDGSVSAAYRYDALHRRVARLEGAAALTYFVHDGWNVVAEYAGSPGSSALAHEVRHVWGEDLGGGLQTAGGVGGLLASVRSSGLSWMHYDGNGNVVLLTDGAGAASARYAYDAFGKLKSSSGPAAEANRYRFSTKPQEHAAALSYYGYRYYVPSQGRWLSRDPLGEAGGVNLYAFVDNMPVGAVDAFGLWSSKSWWAPSVYPLYWNQIAQPVHQMAIDKALRDVSSADRRIIKRRQVTMDEDQSNTHQFTHAMRGPGQTTEEAKRLAEEFVRDKLKEAIEAEKRSKRLKDNQGLRKQRLCDEESSMLLHEKAMEALGDAIHTLQDSTSPMHDGFQEYDEHGGLRADISHGLGERRYPKDDKALIDKTRSAYDIFKGNKPFPEKFFK